MDTQEFEQEMMEEMQENNLDDAADSTEDSMLNSQNWQEAYGVPEPEERVNQHTFLKSSVDSDAPEKVTFMSESELGRPLFNLRFLLDIEDICKFYLDEMAKEYGIDNRISNYFREKINNICSSGMSNKGFVQNLNASRKIEVTRSRIKNLEPIKGGRTR